MSDSFELKLNSPLTKADWNKICDVELEHTKKITYKTPSGKEVVFISLAELEEIKAEIINKKCKYCDIDSNIQKCHEDNFTICDVYDILVILDNHIKEIEEK